MLIEATAPTRISILGGGTDLEPYASKYGGLAISMAINLRQTVTINPDWADCYYRTHPWLDIPPTATPELFKAILKDRELDVKSTFCGQIGAGLGSSASAAVAFIGALDYLDKKAVDKESIAERAFEAETLLCRWHGGRQDQYAASFGGFNLMQFGYCVDLFKISGLVADNIASSMVLIYTGETRAAHKLQTGLQELSEDKVRYLDQLKDIVREGYSQIYCDNLPAIGRLVGESWKLKKAINPKVTTPRIDQIYNSAVDNGAWGGKLLGAGQSGYMMFMVNPFRRSDFIDSMKRVDLKYAAFLPDDKGLEVKSI